MTASGVWGAPSEWLANYHYLSSSGWAPYPVASVRYAAVDSSHINVSSDILNASSQMTVSLIDLSGRPISANSAVPAMTSLGMASAVLPAAAVYPPGSYEYATVDTSTQTTTVYFLNVFPDYAVTTKTVPLSNPLNLASYRTHTTKADPVCPGAWGYALVATGTGDTYDVYNLSFADAVPIGTLKNCQNASISASAAKIGTVDLSLVTVNGTQMIRFINLTGSFSPNDVLVDGLISQIPGDVTGYFGSVSSTSTSTPTTSYTLNKTAMDAALTAWGVPTF
jgi:hypothetical protein